METHGYHLGTVEPDIINGSTIKLERLIAFDIRRLSF